MNWMTRLFRSHIFAYTPEDVYTALVTAKKGDVIHVSSGIVIAGSLIPPDVEIVIGP